MSFSSIDTVWVLFGAVLVFFMQAGFTTVEIGLTRNKNTGNLVMKNIMDFCIGSLAFWLVGFGIMFRGAGQAEPGWPDFFFQGDYDGVFGDIPGHAFLIFQTVFCATSATIISGAMAERTKFSAYCVYSLVMSMLVYPVSGHWIWGGGWLGELGFHDFAGSTAVHLAGGVAALTGAKILGARIGKYDAAGNSRAIPGQSLSLAALGVFILWFAWFGFNACSTLSVTGDASLLSASRIMVNTNLAAASGALTCMLITWAVYKRPDVSMTLNGALGGLVAVTAGCDAVSPGGAAVIGVVAGALLNHAIGFVDKTLKIDDPVGAFGVHGVCGAAGTILVGVFAVDGGLLYGGGPALLGTQILGVLAVALWVALAMGALYLAMDAALGLRVSPSEEIMGLDLEEHGIVSDYPGFAADGGHTSIIRPGAEAAAPDYDHAFSDPAGDPDGSREGARITKVEILTRPEKFADLKAALHGIGITGMTVTKVMGCGVQRGVPDYYRGVEAAASMLPKICVEVVVSRVPARAVIEAAKRILHTGRIGDGKIFVYDVGNVVKVRTGEEGYDALQYSH